MNLKEKINLSYNYCNMMFLNRRRPFFISWQLTKRCNLCCKYCNTWNRDSPELDTFQILKIIKELYEHGVRIIKFTGGEPFLRDDIAEIINYACDIGLFTAISTNGILFPDKIKEIEKIGSVTVSLDGPEEIHDSIRGLGAYKGALAALKTARGKNIMASISTVLNSLNLGSIDYLLNLAKIFDFRIYFQPATKKILYSEEQNPICPDVNQYRRAISYLIKLKKTCKFIGNSKKGLEYLLNWPQRKNIHCFAGKIFCRLDAEGNIYPCQRQPLNDKKLNVVKESLEYCLNNLNIPNCGNCWCSALVELNLICDFQREAITNVIKNI